MYSRFLYQFIQTVSVVFILLLFKKKIRIHSNIRSLVLITFLIIVLTFAMSLGVSYILKILAFFLIGYLFENKITVDLKKRGMTAVIIFFSLCVYLEFFVNLAGYDFSLHNSIFPMSRADGNLIDLDSVFRFSGWQVEPGYHSIIILIALLLESEYSRLSKSKEISKLIVYLSLTSIILSGSVLGISLTVLWVLEQDVLTSRNTKIKLLILMVMPLVLYYLIPYYQVRFGDIQNYRSLNAKLDDLVVVFGRKYREILLGSGFLYETNLHVKDLGFLLASFLRFGAAGLFFSFFLLKRAFVSFRPKYTGVAIILTMKISVLYLPFWVLAQALVSPVNLHQRFRHERFDAE